MKRSESIKAIAPAFLKAQIEIGTAVKGSVNPFFKSNYADLGSVMETCKEALNKNGISVLQPVGVDTVETILLHESGEWFSETMNITAKSDNNPQDRGSAITYARRYSLQSMVFIPAEDDDGNKATPKKDEKKAPVKAVLLSSAQMGKIGALGNKELGWSNTKLTAAATQIYGVKTLPELSKVRASKFIDMLQKKVDEEDAKQDNTAEEFNGKLPTAEDLDTAKASNKPSCSTKGCKNEVTSSLAQSSFKKYGKILCMSCQLKEGSK